MTKDKKEETSVQVNTNVFLQIVPPDLLYPVQNMLRDLGIHLIDLNTGFIIKGNINIDTLGMISKKSFKKPKKSKSNIVHFLIPPETNKAYDIEATINILEPQDEYHPVIFTIQVMDENDLDFWQNIFVQIGQKYLYQMPSGKIMSEAIFHVIPLTLPDPKDPKSAIQAMRGNIQRYSNSGRSNLDQISGYAYPSLDSGYGDEGLDP